MQEKWEHPRTVLKAPVWGDKAGERRCPRCPLPQGPPLLRIFAMIPSSALVTSRCHGASCVLQHQADVWVPNTRGAPKHTRIPDPPSHSPCWQGAGGGSSSPVPPTRLTGPAGNLHFCPQNMCLKLFLFAFAVPRPCSPPPAQPICFGSE